MVQDSPAPRFEHFVLTRFSHRDWRNNSGGRALYDPLHPPNLERRFKLFEATCLPALVGQSEQRFRWLIIVDPELPASYRERLERLVATRERSFLHEFEGRDAHRGLAWLERYLDPATRFVLTTQCDDDDALCTGFVAQLHASAGAATTGCDGPALAIFGASSAVQWDFYYSPRAPLGYSKPWTRRMDGARFPVAGGLSVICDRALDRSVLAFNHRLAPSYFGPPESMAALGHADRATVSEFRDSFRRAVGSAGADFEAWACAERFRWLASDAPQVVVVNHLGNYQLARLFEHAGSRRAVEAGRAFDGVAIDFEAARRNVRSFAPDLSAFVRAAKVVMFPARPSRSIVARAARVAGVLRGFRRMR